MRRAITAMLIACTLLVFAPTHAQDTGGTYTVQAGDTLYSVALRLNVTVFALAQENNLPVDARLRIGQVLRIPHRAATAAPTTSASGVQNTANPVGFETGISLFMNATPLTGLLPAVKDLGLRWVKVPVNWANSEPVRGTFAFGSLDELVTAFNDNGIQMLLTVSETPSWASLPGVSNSAPADFNTYAAFMRVLADRYQGRVRAYEIWEQPNIRRTWNGQRLHGATYAELLKVAFRAIKRADPAALVVSGGLAPTGLNDGVNAVADRVFLAQLYQAGIAGFVDAIGAQPFGAANAPEATCCSAAPGITGWFNDRSFYFKDTLNDYWRLMVGAGDNRHLIWVTRFGWGSAQSVLGEGMRVDPAFGYVSLLTQVQQADYVARAFSLGRELGFVGPMFVYNLNGCQLAEASQMPATNSEPCYYAFLTPARNPRPVYGTLKAFGR